jgi:hypothetical protein
VASQSRNLFAQSTHTSFNGCIDCGLKSGLQGLRLGELLS